MVYALMPLGIGYACVGVDRGYYNPVPREDWELYRAQVPDTFGSCQSTATGVDALD